MRRTDLTARRRKEKTVSRSRAGTGPGAGRRVSKGERASSAVAVATSLRPFELRELLASLAEHRLSLYMPLHAPGAEGPENPVRLKNLLREAESQLELRGVRPADARTMLGPAQALVSDARFWRKGEGGLALLVTPEACRGFRLPHPVAEHVHVGRRFRIRPLLDLMNGGDHFWLLAISQNAVRLFRGNTEAIEPVAVHGLPANMAAALNLDMSIAGDQVHSATTAALGKQAVGKQAAVFHGQGGAADTRKEELAEYSRLIDAALRETLRKEPLPLVVACVAYEFALYRQVSSYAHLVDCPVAGNVDRLGLTELHARAWPLARSHVYQARRAAADRYRALLPAGKATPHIAEILPAAREGRVEALFVARDAIAWGVHDRETAATEVHIEEQPGDEDLLELAAAEVLNHHGMVHSVPADELPGGGKAAAILRFEPT